MFRTQLESFTWAQFNLIFTSFSVVYCLFMNIAFTFVLSFLWFFGQIYCGSVIPEQVFFFEFFSTLTSRFISL